MAQKPIPDRLSLLFPPIAESKYFTYFENSQAHPFQAGRRDFALVNAWWLAEISLLSYSPADEANAIFSRAGLTVAGGKPIEHKGTQCYVVFNDAFVVVAFRGTEVLRPDNWVSWTHAWLNIGQVAGDVATDAQFVLSELSGSPGQFVHRGFAKALDDVWSVVDAELTALRRQRPARTLWFTGHSLGAALATLAAQRCAYATALYTFGAPLVGDAAFARAVRVPAFSFVNGKDCICSNPPCGPYAGPRRGIGWYAPVGQRKDIQRTLATDDVPAQSPPSAASVDRIAGLIAAGRDRLNRNLLEWLPAALIDHAPLLYAVNIWNMYDVSLC